MNRSEYPTHSMHHRAVTMLAALVGAGAAIPTIPAASVVLAADNWAASATRSGVGTYVITLKDKLPVHLAMGCEVIGTDGKRVQVTAFSVTAGTISIQAYTAAGVAVDLATTDTLRILITGRLDAVA